MSGEVYQAPHSVPESLSIHGAAANPPIRSSDEEKRQKSHVHPDCPDVSVVNITDCTTSPF